MIDFRYHVVSIIAVFLALGTGIVIGSTTIDDVLLHNVQSRYDRTRSEADSFRDQRDQLSAVVGRDEDFDRLMAPAIVRHRLSGHSIAVVAGPGADKSLRDKVEAMLEMAGAQVAGTVGRTTAGVRIAGRYTDPTAQQELDELVTNPALLPSGVEFPRPGSPADRAGTLLAAFLVTRQGSDTGHGATVEATQTFAALSAAGYLDVDGPTPPPASMVVVVLAAEPRVQPTPAPSGNRPYAAELALIRALVARGRPVVVVAPTKGAVSDTALSAVRADRLLLTEVSTVDNADTSAGQISMVLALEESLVGTVGQFGTGPGASGVAPTPDPTASPTP